MIYTKLFNNQIEYDNSSLNIKPNISYLQETLSTKFLSYDNYITTIFDVSDISTTTTIINDPTLFEEIIIDNVKLQTLDSSQYQFNETGLHVIKYKKIDDTIIDQNCFYKNKNIVSIKLSTNIKTIYTNSFYYCNNLKYVYIPDYSVTNIGTSAFRECTSLVYIKIPEGVTYIGSYAFRTCSNLKKVILPSTLTSLNISAFYICNLNNIFISKNITNIYTHSTFGGNPNLLSIIVDQENTKYDSRNNCNAIIITATNKLLMGCKNTVIPETVTTIGENAFELSNLTNIVIPNSVTTIENGAFINCKKLLNVQMSNNVETIGSSVFEGCEQLKTIILPNNLTILNAKLFYNCHNLNNIQIPDTVTSLGTQQVFARCYALENIQLPNSVTIIPTSTFFTNTNLKTFNSNINGECNITNNFTTIGSNAFSYCISFTTLIISDSVLEIGDSAFERCNNLTSITLGSGITSISTNCFLYCTSLLNLNNAGNTDNIINIPNNIVSIGVSAFQSCSKITTVKLPNTITSIEKQAFYNCSKLINVIIEATVPPTLGTAVFSLNNKNRKIYVPDESLETYKNANGWSEYTDYIEPISNY